MWDLDFDPVSSFGVVEPGIYLKVRLLASTVQFQSNGMYVAVCLLVLDL